MITANSSSSKLPNVGKTIFAVMSEFARQYNAVDLSRGFPDFDPDVQLIEHFVKHLKEGHNQYAPVDGLFDLRALISGEITENYNKNYSAEHEITITGGATEAIYTAITAFVKEGDEVIIFEPAYDCYAPAVKLNGGIPVFIDLKLPNFHYDWDQVNNAINAKTRMIIINTPHNPTGTLFTALDAERLKRAVNGTNIMVLSDEVYEHVIFDNHDHESLVRHESIRERVIVIKSFGKSYHVTGWRLGYVLADASIMKEFRKVHQYLMYTANTTAQYAFADYLAQGKKYAGVSDLYQKKRDYFVELLTQTPFILQPSRGTYFQCVSFDQLSEHSDIDFSIELIKNAGVASIPLSPFYNAKTDNKMIRFCFAKKEETLEEAVKKLTKYFSQR